MSGSTPPSLRRIDDKCRIYHPPLAELDGWAAGIDCSVTVDDDFLHIRVSTGIGGELGRFDGARLRVPPARLQAIGVSPGEDVAVLVDVGTATVTVAAGAHLTDAFWAVGELEQLRNQLSHAIAERDAALADAKRAQDRADLLAEFVGATKTPATTTPLIHLSGLS